MIRYRLAIEMMRQIAVFKSHIERLGWASKWNPFTAGGQCRRARKSTGIKAGSRSIEARAESAQKTYVKEAQDRLQHLKNFRISQIPVNQITSTADDDHIASLWGSSAARRALPHRRTEAAMPACFLPHAQVAASGFVGQRRARPPPKSSSKAGRSRCKVRFAAQSARPSFLSLMIFRNAIRSAAASPPPWCASAAVLFKCPASPA